MPRRFLPHLRRCRLPFVLALCAWLMLVSMAWAQSGCCEGLSGGSAISMDSMHSHAGMHGMDHHDGQAATNLASDGACTHAPATLPGVAALGLPSALPGTDGLPQPHSDTPQPASKPLLRPPAA